MNEPNSNIPPRKRDAVESCPHCGRSLSLWEQVLLNVDRALMCKGCWYRIIVDRFPEADRQDDTPHEKKSE